MMPMAAQSCGGQPFQHTHMATFVCVSVNARSAGAALTESLLKSKRWLLGNKPRLPSSPHWEKYLLMNSEAQTLFMERVLTSFVQRAKKRRSGGRQLGLRWSMEEWDKNADYAALVARVVEAAQTTSVGDNVLIDMKVAYVTGPVSQPRVA